MIVNTNSKQKLDIFASFTLKIFLLKFKQKLIYELCLAEKKFLNMNKIIIKNFKIDR